MVSVADIFNEFGIVFGRAVLILDYGILKAVNFNSFARPEYKPKM